ncbi:phospholipase A2 [Cylas formicarius]|uniref:phospholipase A2 n=1 Tax=Cylas formicarius TaxID=197179 RepID=UPI002958465A|nr:phospholipase A2 [Cylas formicarius]XP_060526381.1 phospholipase A2 [Cylas formicarius]
MRIFVLGVLFHCAFGLRPACDTQYDTVQELVPFLNPKSTFFNIRNFLKPRNNVAKTVVKFGSDKTRTDNSTPDYYVVGHALKPPKMARQSQERNKRGVVHLYNMVSCATGCNPLSYKGYGCYCGFLGSGFPVDGIDMCCKRHDWCYDAARCPMYLEYLVPYYWKCWYGSAFCAIDHGEFGGPASCADKLCECDRQLSVCLKKYPCPSKPAFCKSSPLRFFQNIFMFFA